MSISEMKKWTIIFASLMLLVLSVVGASKSYAGDKLMSASFDSVRVYYAMDKVTGAVASSVFNVTVITPKEVAYGKYDSFAYKGDTLRVISWSGSGSAPTLVLTDFDTINNSNCPGIDTKIFRCAYMTFKITVASDDYGCPWIASFYSYTDLPGFGSYTAPTVHNTICPTIPVASYDISWSENYVSHNKALRIQSTGSTVTTTLSTYLMEGGRLCDGSNFSDNDGRGAYCRAVSELLTFTSSGCDKSTVTVTPTRHPVTDKVLHDIVVNVNTSSGQPIDSTCRFQYVLNEL
ncbi:StfH/YfcO family fimbrial adhesin [Escherichia coli]